MHIWQRISQGLARLPTKLAAWFSNWQRVDDEGPSWWADLTSAGPADRPWTELYQDLTDALEAWRKNFLVRQIVRLTTAYVVGDGITVTSEVPAVAAFIELFWTHPENKLGARLSAWCDELTRAGELYPILFTNKYDGMSQVRVMPATSIASIETDPDDYEKETGYEEWGSWAGTSIEQRHWKSRRTARVFAPREDRRHRRPEPMMLHYAINRPVGATRGEGDLGPILPWAQRYGEWLRERVRWNRLRNDLAAVVITLEDDTQVQAKRQFYQSNPPTGGSIVVVGKGESIEFPSARIEAADAEPDGRALRLAIAAGADIPLHFLAEGSSATRSTAEEMGDPTHRHYRMRQEDFAGFLVDLCEQAWRRFEQVHQLEPLADLGLKAQVPDISRADNSALATAAKTIVEAFATMKANGWITDDLAVRLAFKFAGEVLPEDEIKKIVGMANERMANEPTAKQPNGGASNNGSAELATSNGRGH